MKNRFYTTLGFITWQGLKLYIAQKTPSRPVLLGGAAAAAIVAGLIGVGVAKREDLTGS
jgi:hypothetical protein